MKSILSIRSIRVENANAIAGLTYGFPAISNFLGFTHALSRALQLKLGGKITLGGCAVVCHQCQVHAHQPAGWGDYVFALTRNPLTKEGNTQPFNEEGRMHMEVSLLIECAFDSEDFDFGLGEERDVIQFNNTVFNQAMTQRLAGGAITSIGSVNFSELPQDADALRKYTRKQLLKLLPGFVLVDRSELLKTHHANNPQLEFLDAWLDFSALKYRAATKEQTDDLAEGQAAATWERVPKPAGGWLVPITAGYRAISPLYKPGEVARARDVSTPFRFVEPIYGVGEWLSPHRVKKLNDVIWRYHAESDWYLCINSNSPSTTEINPQ